MGLAEPQSAEALVKRWRSIIACVALGLPAISVAVTFLIATLSGPTSLDVILLFGKIQKFLPSKPSIFEILLNFPRIIIDFVFSVTAFYVLLVVCSWPFLVYAIFVTARIRKRWPAVASIHWASAGGLIGLSLPYLFVYAAQPFELTSGAKDAGEGIGIFIFIFCISGVPLILATIGWFIGSFLGFLVRA
jgi:hypothetical protein